MQKTTKTYTIHEEKELDDIDISLTPGDRIFFVWDLGAGKSTMIRHILRKYLNDPTLVVRSPTYTYYQKYGNNIYHFDLYRLEDYETWVSIGGEEIAEDPTTIMLIEWPEILGERVQYTTKISIEVMENGEREVVVEKL
jgi:tRNA threonylcarbamoyladenosine biosynthesis protein TsaE